MSPQEFWALADELKAPEMVGKIPKSTVDELIAELHAEEGADHA